jgi:hypothetical protein
MTQYEDVPYAGDERTLLTTWLDYHRTTVARKCEGLAEELAHRALLPTSPLMTVAGLISHLRWVEHAWFEHRMAGGPDQGPWTDDDVDRDFKVDDVPLDRLLREYGEQCGISRKITASMGLDDESGIVLPRGRVTLRWVLGHMIEETARHNGHLDIIREMLDGATGE